MASTFQQRYEWLQTFFATFTKHIEGVTADFIHKSDLDDDYPIRGYEHYHIDEIGKKGYFVEKDDSILVDVSKLNIPDCYELINKKGYLRVPDIKTSRYLRSKGDIFRCKCVPYDDEFWEVVENIPEIE